MAAYYNEHDPFAAAWLRELITAGHIADGVVDERSILEVTPEELSEFTQCHFFAGIGVWSHSLREAGWPDDRPVWTGSCPCQPFSDAGKGKGTNDARHLWPTFFQLIRARRPAAVFGEQVASKAGLAWLDLVSADMEGAAYSFGAFDLCASGVGAPHLRQRIYFVADPKGKRRDWRKGSARKARRDRVEDGGAVSASRSGDVAHADGQQPDEPKGEDGQDNSGSFQGGGELRPRGGGELCDVGNPRSEGSGRHTGAVLGAQGESQGEGGRAGCEPDELVASSSAFGLADSDGGDSSAEGLQRGGKYGQQPEDNSAMREDRDSGPTNGFWRACDWVYCTDDKFRAVEPGTFPLVDGAAKRMGRLRGYGNAIVAPLAIEVIGAYLDLDR